MAYRKKQKKFTLWEVRLKALHELEKKHFGGGTPSDFDNDWTWGNIDMGHEYSENNAFGIWLRFKTKCFCISFEEIGFYPVFDDNFKVTHFLKTSEQ